MGDARDPDEFFDLAEKIIQNINTVFEKDGSLDEFDIVPVESQSNRSPVIHVNHKLALESWCVPFLYSHSFKCFTQLLPNRKVSAGNHKNQHRNGSTSVRNGSIGSHEGHTFVNSRLTEGDRTERKLNLSRILILLNPDLTLAWNYRREAFIQCCMQFQHELHLVSLVASRKPKSSEVFMYRKWLVKHILNEDLKGDNIEQIFTREMQAAGKAAEAYFSNYHAWDYRRWLLETFLGGSFCPDEFKLTILNSEKNCSDNWVERHISDHSGFHYRQKLLSQMSLLECNVNGVFQLFTKELENNLSLVMRFPGHEALWYHRRFLLQFLVPKLQMELTENLNNHHQPMETNWECEVWQCCEDKIQYLKKKEEDLVKSILTVNASLVDDASVNFITKDSSNLSILYSQKHAKWLFMMFEWIIDNN
ncbi:unnamed protein product [Allacma fusca]|uniref:Protein prenyltransferase alpha subunit repeat-containing protein 1 n=1 Tax=Allacma fusca TaxID=39272 RepID=A0A8J2LXA7_9HEXA|nr:unnamed protein product [Allacma fusca]